MKLITGVITAGNYNLVFPTEFAWSLYGLQGEIWRGDTPVKRHCLMRSGKFPTDVARNEIVRMFLDTDADRLLFLDVDHKFTPKSVVRLLESEHDIITGRYHVKRPPYHPNLYVTPRGDHGEGEFQRVHYGQGVFEVDRCGAGALLIKRRVLEAVGDPWFRYGRDPKPPHDLSVSEDFYFCERAQAEGFRIMADWDAEFEHLVMGWVDGDWSTQYLDTMERGIAAGRPDLAESLIALGYPDGYTLPSGETVPPYERRDSV